MSGKANRFQAFETPQAPVFAPNEGSATVASRLLGTASTAETITIAANQRIFRICATADIFYSITGTADENPGDEDSGASIYLPSGVERYVQIEQIPGTTSLSVISGSANAKVNVLSWS